MLRFGVLVSGWFIGVCGFATAGDWTQWRGTERSCQVADGAGLPERLAEDGIRAAWTVPLGPGYSGPIIAGELVYVTETVDEEREVVRALKLDSGEEVWRAEWPGAMTVPFFAAANGSWIRSTPAFDGERLYVAGMCDVLVALNGATGEEVWRVDFTQEFGTPKESFGFVCSPLVSDGRVYVQTGAGLVCLDAQTGTVVWRGLAEQGGMMGGAFSSPVLATIQGRPQLVVQTRAQICGVALESGEALWSVDVPAFRGMNILTPTVMGDSVFTSSYGGGSVLFRIDRTAEGYGVTEVWQKNTEAYMSSPVVVDGRLYLHLRNQRFTCIDADSSETQWTTRPFGKYWSLAMAGTRLLALDERGELLLIEATPEEYREIDRRRVSDSSTWAHLAVADNRLAVRALDGLTIWEWEAGEAGVAASGR